MWRKAGPAAEIRAAIELLQAERIGHGTTLLEDPAVRDLVVERGVTIEACATSNFHTGVIEEVEQHPIGAWLELGVRACVWTDNTYLSERDRGASAHPPRARKDAERLACAVRFGHEARFVR